MNTAICNADNFMKSFAGQCSKPVPFKCFHMFCRPLLATVHLALVVSTPRLWFMDVSKKASPLWVQDNLHCQGPGGLSDLWFRSSFTWLTGAGGCLIPMAMLAKLREGLELEPGWPGRALVMQQPSTVCHERRFGEP